MNAADRRATTPSRGSITVAGATAIGVGGMMGAGLYTLLGLGSTTAGVWLPVAFAVGGVVSVFSVYSYSHGPSLTGSVIDDAADYSSKGRRRVSSWGSWSPKVIHWPTFSPLGD